MSLPFLRRCISGCVFCLNKEGSHTIILSVTSPDGGVLTTSVHITVIDPGLTTTIRSASELVSKLNALTFAQQSGNLPTTEDIRIDGTVSVSSLQLTVPQGLSAGPYCFIKTVSFGDAYGVDGIHIKPVLTGAICPFGPAVLTITDTTLRFRPLIIKIRVPPILFDFPVIKLLPPSDYVCSDNQTKCPIDNVCYEDYQEYCLYCLALSPEECACRDGGSILSDGTPCTIYPSGDVLFKGICSNGLCLIK
jgi:hypothetical protein